MAESAFFTVEAATGVREMRALVGVEFSTVGAFLTIAQKSKSLAVECCRVDADVREAAVVVVAAAFLKMLTSGRIVSSMVVGKRACISFGTLALEQPALADSLLLWIMNATTSMSTAYACASVSCGQRERIAGLSVSCVPVRVKVRQSDGASASVCCMLP
jgi:hypothetical protein